METAQSTEHAADLMIHETSQCQWYVPECYTPLCKERSIVAGGGEGIIRVVPVSYCGWYVLCESPHGMFLACVI